MFLCLPTTGSAAPGDEHWDFRFGRAGIDASVLALTWHEGQLHAAGWFTTAGHTLANSITRWDDLVGAGSHAEAARAGLQRLEGKTYEVQDGDVLNVRFNV